MRKKLRLTESELVGLVKKVIEGHMVSEQVEEMDEQSQMPGFTPQMTQLYDFIKKNSISDGAVFKVFEYMKQSKPAAPPNPKSVQAAPQKQPVQKAATQTTPTSAKRADQRNYSTSTSVVR